MVYRATQYIANEFTRKDLKFDVRETENSSLVSITCNGDNVKSLNVLFISRDNDPDVAVRAFALGTFPAEKRQKGINLANDLNREYRYLKFALDNDGDLNAEFDFPLRCSISEVGDLAMELLSRCLKIVDEAYPKIMQALWG